MKTDYFVSISSGLPAAGAACWDPAFVAKIVLGGKGAPQSCDTKEPTLKALKRAIAGEKVAVVIDATQAKAVPKLPGGAGVKTLASSGPLPSGLVVAVGDPGPLGPALVKALRKMEKDKAGRETLTALRSASFREPHAAALGAFRAKYEGK